MSRSCGVCHEVIWDLYEAGLGAEVNNLSKVRLSRKTKSLLKVIISTDNIWPRASLSN